MKRGLGEKAPELFEKSKEDYKPERTRSLAQRIIDNPDTPITRQQQMDLLYDKMQLRKENADVVKKYNEALKGDDQDAILEAKHELDSNVDAIDKNTQATKQIGTTTSDIFRDRQLLADLEKGTLENDLAIARSKNGNRELSPEQKKSIEDIHAKLEEANTELESMLKAEKEKTAKLEAELALRKMRKDAFEERKAGRERFKEQLKSDREKLYQKLYTIQNKQLSATVNPFQGFSPEAVKVIGQIGKSYFDEGVISAKDIIDKIHEDLKDKFPGVDKESIMDAISGYGKQEKQTKDELAAKYNDIKQQIKNMRKLEDLERGERPLVNSTEKREPSPELKSLRDKVKEAMDKEGFSQEDRNTTIKNNLIKKLHALENGERPIDKTTGKRIDTPEITSLRKQIKDLENEKGFTQEKQNRTYYRNLVRRAEKLKAKLESKDFSKPEPKPTREYPPAIAKKQGEIELYRRQIQMEQRKIELANKSNFEKVLRKVVKFSRGMKLTGMASVLRLTAFSGEKMIIQPGLEAYGGILSKIPGLKTIMDQAPVEGGFAGIQAEAKSFTDFVKAINSENFKDIMEHGGTKFSARYGDDEIRMDLDPELLDYFARFHTVLKEPLKESIWNRAYTKYRTWQMKQPGFKGGDEIETRKAELYAMNEAQRGILLRDNKVTHLYNKLLNDMEKSGNAGKVTAAIGRFLLPIVRVPTNFAFEASEYNFGLLKGGISIAKHLADGTIKDLSPEQADYIARNLKKGSVGALLMYIGYRNRDNIGGYYQQGEKKGSDDIPFGSFRIFGWQPKLSGIDLGAYLAHNPIFSPLMMGATAGHVMDDYAKKAEEGKETGSVAGNIWESGYQAAKGSIDETPFISEPKEIIDSMKNSTSLGQFFGQIISGAVLPPDIGKAAKVMDLDPQGNVIHRKPTGSGLDKFIQTIEMQIPVLRKNVPLSNPAYQFKQDVEELIEKFKHSNKSGGNLKELENTIKDKANTFLNSKIYKDYTEQQKKAAKEKEAKAKLKRGEKLE